VANATVTVKASGGDYTTLNAALAGEAADLTANCHSTGGAGILPLNAMLFRILQPQQLAQDIPLHHHTILT